MDVLDLTRHLVATPSPNLPGDERAVAALVQDAATQLGIDRGVIHAELPHRPNVIIDLDFGSGGRHLALSGHLDTKPVGDAVWSTNPFEAVDIDGYLYGLGTCDMKGAVAAMLIAASEIASEGMDKGRLSLAFTADEEFGSKFGSRYLAEQRLVTADAIVIGEPGGIRTDWDQLNIVSRGIANIYVDVFGDQGHSSLSEVKGNISATQSMARLLLRFASEFKPAFPANSLGSSPTVNAGVTVSGGVGFGVIPGLATFSSDIRLVPGMEREEFTADLTEFLRMAIEQDPNLRAEFRFEDAPRDWLPPTAVDPEDPIVTACQLALTSVLGAGVPLGSFPGTTDACWMQGILGIPTLPAFGPGMLDRAHAADERVSIEALRQSVPIYKALIREFCAGAS